MCLVDEVKRKLFLLFATTNIEFSPRQTRNRKMHVLTNEIAKDRFKDRLPLSDIHEASSMPRILTDAPTMDHLDALEAQSIYILREAFARLKKLALLWSLGKDSNVMIWLARKAFFGKVPFPCLHVDTGKKFPEMYAFRDRYAGEWGLDLKVDPCPPIETIDPTLPPAARSAARKTEGLKLALAKYGFDGLIAGIRRDEEATRAKERVFSPRGLEGHWDVRDQPPEFWDQFNASPPPGAHLRIHPILHWTESDIWAYTARENIPIIPLYLAKDGKRYRSLGDADITFPVASTAATIPDILTELEQTKVPERAGRALDHETEDAFERLRVAGYL
jgi:sulfate adenylyltransferase subunit 2